MDLVFRWFFAFIERVSFIILLVPLCGVTNFLMFVMRITHLKGLFAAFCYYKTEK